MTTVANHSAQISKPIIFFDMDGTLLDLAFDTYIWMQRIPERWAVEHQATLEQAKSQLYQYYLHYQGSLNWYSSKFWRQHIGVDAFAVQQEYRHLIAPRLGCFELLNALQKLDVECWIVSNADQVTLDLKLENVLIRPYFKQVISSESIGYAKEDQRFWQTLQQRYPFDVSQVSFIDDNYAVLDSAKQFGIAQLFSIREPDSSNTRTELNPNYIHLEQLTDLLNYLDDDKSSNLYGT